MDKTWTSLKYDIASELAEIALILIEKTKNGEIEWQSVQDHNLVKSCVKPKIQGLKCQISGLKIEVFLSKEQDSYVRGGHCVIITNREGKRLVYNLQDYFGFGSDALDKLYGLFVVILQVNEGNAIIFSDTKAAKEALLNVRAEARKTD